MWIICPFKKKCNIITQGRGIRIPLFDGGKIFSCEKQIRSKKRGYHRRFQEGDERSFN